MAAKKKVTKKKPAAKPKSAPKSTTRKRSEPQTFRARASHASFTVNDLAKSIAFYRDGIGFVVKDTWKRDGKVIGVELRAGTVEFFLNQDDGAKGWDRKKGLGMSVSFVTSQSVDAIAARLKGAGYALLAEPRDMEWGARAFRVADPDGFLVSISS